MLGYKTSAELIGQNVRMIMPEPHHSNHDSKSPFMCFARSCLFVCVHVHVHASTTICFVSMRVFVTCDERACVPRVRVHVRVCVLTSVYFCHRLP